MIPPTFEYLCHLGSIRLKVFGRGSLRNKTMSSVEGVIRQAVLRRKTFHILNRELGQFFRCLDVRRLLKVALGKDEVYLLERAV